MSQKRDFVVSAYIHLRNIFSRRVECGFFSSFYSENGSGAYQRCLLDELKNTDGEVYLTGRKVKAICPFYDGFASKCFYDENFPNREKELENEREKIISKLTWIKSSVKKDELIVRLRQIKLELKKHNSPRIKKTIDRIIKVNLIKTFKLI